MIVTITETLSQGFLPDVFTWMQRTATEKHVPESGRHGRLICDEMSIQRDLQLDSRDGHSRLSGMVDLGRQGNDLDKCLGVDESEDKYNNSVSASHILQMEFLGFTGFVFPFAHFPTVGVQAHHLVLLFWQAVSMLYEYGFYVHFCLFDGASANRSFL